MFNREFNSDPDDPRHQEYDVLNGSDEDEVLHRNFDNQVREIKLAAFHSCISDIDVDDDDAVKGIWEQVLSFARRPYVREAAIITAILLLRTGLFMAYRAAHKQGLEVVNL